MSASGSLGRNRNVTFGKSSKDAPVSYQDTVYTRNEPGDSRVEIDLVLPEKSVNDFHKNLRHIFADPRRNPNASAFGALDRNGRRIA